MRYTVLGARGFIGSNLTAALRADGHQVFAPVRDDPSIFDSDLGRVFYCVGLTADFNNNPSATVEAHAGLVSRVVERSQFDTFVYLSSTRLYDLLEAPAAKGDAVLPMQPSKQRHLYDLSKALGENLCLCVRPTQSSVARLSGVYDWKLGSPGFLSEWLQKAACHRSFSIDTASGIVRDYIHVDDVVQALRRMADTGVTGIFNVASGENVSNAELAERFNRSGWTISLARQSVRQHLPRCDIESLVALGVTPRRVFDVIEDWIGRGSKYEAR